MGVEQQAVAVLVVCCKQVKCPMGHESSIVLDANTLPCACCRSWLRPCWLWTWTSTMVCPSTSSRCCIRTQALQTRCCRLPKACWRCWRTHSSQHRQGMQGIQHTYSQHRADPSQLVCLLPAGGSAGVAPTTARHGAEAQRPRAPAQPAVLPGP